MSLLVLPSVLLKIAVIAIWLQEHLKKEQMWIFKGFFPFIMQTEDACFLWEVDLPNIFAFLHSQLAHWTSYRTEALKDSLHADAA